MSLPLKSLNRGLPDGSAACIVGCPSQSSGSERELRQYVCPRKLSAAYCITGSSSSDCK